MHSGGEAWLGTAGRGPATEELSSDRRRRGTAMIGDAGASLGRAATAMRWRSKALQWHRKEKQSDGMAEFRAALLGNGLDSSGLALRGKGSARQSFDERGNGFAVPGISPQRRGGASSDPTGHATRGQGMEALCRGEADQSEAKQRRCLSRPGDAKRGNGEAWRVGAGHGNGKGMRGIVMEWKIKAT